MKPPETRQSEGEQMTQLPSNIESDLIAEQPSTVLLRLAHWQLRRGARPRRAHSRLAVGTAVTLGVVVLAATAAMAYFTAHGTGSGAAQSATASNLTITAVSTPSPVNHLYPGSNGDVVLQITNPNVFPVTITAVSLPSASSYATGYTTFTSNTFSGAVSGCSSSTSLVAWNYASGTNPHTLASALTVGAGGTLTVTMTNDATMGLNAPAACEGIYFSMPSLTAITATSSTSAATSSPTTDSWSS